MNLKKNASILAAAAALTLAAGSSWGQDVKGGPGALLGNGAGVQVNNPIVQPAEGAAALCYTFEGRESWDLEDDPSNMVLELDIGAGNAMTGIAWDVNITTEGASWLSEAVMRFSDSSGPAAPNFLYLTVGVGEGAPGSMDFTSNGVVDLTDNGITDITAGPDGILQIHLFESFDDVDDAIDANYANAAAPVTCPGIRLVCTDQGACDGAVSGLPQSIPVPTNTPWALILMAMVLAGLGIVAVRRFA